MTGPSRHVVLDSERIGTAARPLPPQVDLQLDLSELAALDATVLRALHRGGVVGDTAIAVLAALTDVALLLDEMHAPRRLAARVVADASRVRVDIDLDGEPELLGALADALSRYSSVGGASRPWGTVHDQRGNAVWIEIERPRVTVLDGRTGGERRDAASRLEVAVYELATRLRHAQTLDEIDRALNAAVRNRIRARYVGVALQSGTDIELLANAGSAPPASVGPVGAAVRDGRARVYRDVAQVEEEFPGIADQLRLYGHHALVSVPLSARAPHFGALVATWSRARDLDHVIPLLIVAARHTAQAVQRIDARVAPVSRGLLADPPNARAEPSAFQLDFVARSVAVPGREAPIRLTGREFELLIHLLRRGETPVSRADLLRDVWGIDFSTDTSVVDVTVSRLRRKLGRKTVVTVRDRGYMLRRPLAR